MSDCRSCSLRRRPGGQPSTTQPSAGPWLSPKLVTVKSLPKMFPDIGAPLGPSVELQIPRPQHEDGTAADINLGPDERQAGECAQQRSLAVAYLHHQQSLVDEMMTRRREDAPHRIEPIQARLEADAGLAAILARQCSHLRPSHVG